MEVAEQTYDVMSKRRTVRNFSDRAVSKEVIETLIRTATTAPSGANKQPWRFIAVSDPALKQKIRHAAEAEEREFYARRASSEWLEDLAPLGTDSNKEFLEIAPWLIVLFRLTKTDEGGQVYYSQESVGLAAGFFLAAAHMAGLATLTHTPSPMGFLQQILRRPSHEKPFLLIPVGYPATDCKVPAFASQRRPLKDVLLFDDRDYPK
jgi:nitroreductase